MNREQRRYWRTYVLACRELTLAHKIVLLALETFADYPAGTNARPSRAALAEMCCLGERVVDTALHQGRGLKLIEQTARANPKLGLAAVYRLLPQRISTRTSVQVETGFNSQESRFNSHEDGVSTRTGVRATNPLTPIHNTNTEKARAKATYLPDDWCPPPEVVAQMRSEQSHVDQDLELRKFIDYWRSTAKNAQKRDWAAVYRNWIRRAAENTNGQRPSRARSTTDERVASVLALKTKFRSSPLELP